jgi:hypothetical protein
MSSSFSSLCSCGLRRQSARTLPGHRSHSLSHRSSHAESLRPRPYLGHRTPSNETLANARLALCLFKQSMRAKRRKQPKRKSMLRVPRLRSAGASAGVATHLLAQLSSPPAGGAQLLRRIISPTIMRVPPGPSAVDRLSIVMPARAAAAELGMSSLNFEGVVGPVDRCITSLRVWSEAPAADEARTSVLVSAAVAARWRLCADLEGVVGTAAEETTAEANQRCAAAVCS